MGIFPGAKAYFRETTRAFSSERPSQKPSVIVTDIMLLLYMFDAYRAIKETENPSYVGSLHDLARFLFRRIEHPDNVERIESWQTHIVTFDVPGCSPRAKEATQQKRSTRVTPIEGELHETDDDAPLPKSFSASLRTKGFLANVVQRLLIHFEHMYTKSHFFGDLILQWRNIPKRLYRHPQSGDSCVDLLNHAHSVTSIGEGDMSICYWIQYFNADATLVITKDTDMLLLLALAAPLKGKTVTLRLDFGTTVDYIDICAFRAWLNTRYSSVYDGFLYCVLQGNDYVEKVTKGCGATAHLDALVKVCQAQRPVVAMHNGSFLCDEAELKDRMQRACVRGGLIESKDICIRQALWYLFYALHAMNGSNVASNMCASRFEGESLFGWMTTPENAMQHARRVAETPAFVLV
jgi:hypothetical protein